MDYLDYDLIIDNDLTITAIFNDTSSITSKMNMHPTIASELHRLLMMIEEERSIDKSSIENIGKILADLLFPPDIREHFYKARQQSPEHGVRIKLRIDNPSIASYPWESLYLDGIFIATAEDLILVRVIPSSKVKHRKFERPMRILYVSSNPMDTAHLDIGREFHIIEDTVTRFNDIQLERLDEATIPRLYERLNSTEYDILHFTGHGVFSDNVGHLVLEDDNSMAIKIDYKSFRHILQNQRSLRLVILNTVESANVSSSDIYGGFAPQLIQVGIPSVIGMRYRITEDMAHRFSQYFYERVTLPDDQNIQRIRHRLLIDTQSSPVDFISPILYTADRITNAQATANLYEQVRTSAATATDQLSDELRLATYIASDQWTTADALGYHMYAYAIAKFITNKDTRTPISISIQSPWGGGKTSLMRMVRAMLDKNAPDEIEKEGNGNGNSQKELVKGEKLKDGNIKVKDLEKELEQRKPDELPIVKNPESFGEDLLEPRITIWFNAWKYENTEQVWAGLADSIVKGIADRLSPIEREWFYLRLNLRRQDVESIRSWITDYIWNNVWKKASPWIITSISGVVASSLTGITEFALQQPAFAYAGLSLSAIFGGLGITQTLSKKESIENEPAEVSLGKFVTVPDYKEKLGFIHHVKRDLDLVFETIPDKKFRELVIFIDDLDRCSPNNVAQVIEGINLFLAGEFPGCIFVIGMDAEMVAAALEVAHEEVIKKLPNYYAHMPIGWRFMDKFIQLPIIIPPSLQENVKTYANTLLSEYSLKNTNSIKETKVGESKTSTSATTVQRETNANIAASSLTLKPEQMRDIQVMNVSINNASDTDEQFLKQVSDALADFSYNPREIKRFINALRFQRFLMMLSMDKLRNTPSFDQVRRWTVLSLKWPQVARWLYWGTSTFSKTEKGYAVHSIRERLELLETYSLESEDMADWRKKLQELLQIKDENVTTHWINSEELREFFRREKTMYNDQLLSIGAGLGLY